MCFSIFRRGKACFLVPPLPHTLATNPKNRTAAAFELATTILWRTQVMTCNKREGRFSWMGQASLGGYIGEDFEAFFSSVVSGASGTYLNTLEADAGIISNVAIRAGQAVHLSSDPSLAEALSWGGGGFNLEQMGALSLTRLLQLGRTTVSVDVTLHLSGCSFRDIIWHDESAQSTQDGGALQIMGKAYIQDTVFAGNTKYGDLQSIPAGMVTVTLKICQMMAVQGIRFQVERFILGLKHSSPFWAVLSATTRRQCLLATPEWMEERCSLVEVQRSPSLIRPSTITNNLTTAEETAELSLSMVVLPFPYQDPFSMI